MALPQENTAQKRSGLNPLSYMGVEAATPPQLLVQDRKPTRNDSDNVRLGAIWVYNDRTAVPWYPYIYMLTNLYGGYATWTPLAEGTGSIGYFLADDGNYAYPLPDGQISIIGDGISVKTSAPPGTPNTLVVSLISQDASEFQTNSGIAAPDPITGILNIYGGTNMRTKAAAADTVLVTLQDSVSLSGSLTVGTGGATPPANGIISTGATTLNDFIGFDGVVTSTAGVLGTLLGTANQVLTTNPAGTGLLWASPGGGSGGTYSPDSGTDPVSPTIGGLLNVKGGSGTVIKTVGSLNTVGIRITSAAIPGNGGAVLVGTGASTEPAWGTIVGGTGITITQSGTGITVTAGGGGGSGGIVKATGGDSSSAVQDGLNNINLVGYTNQILTTAGALGGFPGANTLLFKISPTLVIPGTMQFSDTPFQHIGLLKTDATGNVSSVGSGTLNQAMVWGSGGPAWTTISTGGASTFGAQNGGTATAVITNPNVTITGGSNINTTAATSVLVVNLNKNIILPATTNGSSSPAYQGVLALGSSASTDCFVHGYGSTGTSYNCFYGHGAGNFTNSGATHNVGLGADVLKTLSSGDSNTCAGYQSCDALSSSASNSCYGASSGGAITTGTGLNCLFGYSSASGLTTGSNNCVYGASAFTSATNATQNVIIGNLAASSIVASGATANAIIGYGAMASVADAGAGLSSHNTGVGFEVGTNMLSANYVTALGYQAGIGNLTGITVCTSSIFLGAIGLSTDPSHSIYIGNHGSGNNQQDSCYIAGINGATAASTAKIVTIDSVNKLAPAAGTMSTGGVLIGSATGPTWGTLTSTGQSINITTTTPGTINLEQGSTYGFSAYLPTTIPGVTGKQSPEVIFVLGTGGYALTEDFDDGGNFYPGDGSSTPARYTAPYTGLYNFVINIGYGYTIPTPPVIAHKDPIYLKVWNGASLVRTYVLDYILPTTVAGTYVIVGQQTTNVKLTAGYTVTFSFSAQIAATNIVSVYGSGGGSTIYTNVSGFLVGVV